MDYYILTLKKKQKEKLDSIKQTLMKKSIKSILIRSGK
ncbi:hypothetical protein HFN_0990 [Helicobacter fennelliae MRY12-0050]|uniref:Uncharacterized protein n=1 Tax=Helicobacter fennelliae MRY12-0050 TaxID=1325130 RepID=T1D0L6_9HELI|nr:hypothetical protein HFN_0990 [Helicobacter fennelliae MRY12-0050]